MITLIRLCFDGKKVVKNIVLKSKLTFQLYFCNRTSVIVLSDRESLVLDVLDKNTLNQFELLILSRFVLPYIIMQKILRSLAYTYYRRGYRKRMNLLKISWFPDFIKCFPDFSLTVNFSRFANANVAVVWIRAWY